MSTRTTRATAVRLMGILLVSGLSIVSTGCYTRQIEGIQRDLDLMDRKLHKVNSTGSTTEGSSISPTDITEIKRELEMVRSQQMGLSSDLETLRVESDQLGIPSELPGPYPMPENLPNSEELEILRKQISANQKKLDRFDREMKEMQTTFDEVRTSMLDVIHLLQEEYVEDGASTAPVSAPVEESASAPQISLSAPAGGSSNLYEVKAGDSLNLIAKRFNVSVDELKRMNEITNPDRLVMGQKIYIP